MSAGPTIRITDEAGRLDPNTSVNIHVETYQGPRGWVRITSEPIQRGDVEDLLAALVKRPKPALPWKQRPRGELMLAVLDWVLAEHMAGRRPNDVDVAKKFDLDLEFTIALHKELEEMGEV